MVIGQTAVVLCEPVVIVLVRCSDNHSTALPCILQKLEAGTAWERGQDLTGKCSFQSDLERDRKPAFMRMRGASNHVAILQSCSCVCSFFAFSWLPALEWGDSRRKECRRLQKVIPATPVSLAAVHVRENGRCSMAVYRS